ncbi:MAG: heme-binding domain-containing protein [Candidatus Hydrogenedentes bacterium]|nr:heme-binding domain-containing protein [Candidatus Hydrogenedentota bacterium]
MRKKVIVLVVLVVLAVLALPVSNLLYSPKSSAMARIATEDKQFAAALEVMAEKCGYCHTSNAALPIYSGLPVARGIIQRDITEGTRYVDYLQALSPGDGKPVSEIVLAKTEYVVEHGTMPPQRFRVMHWSGGLSASEKAALMKWIKEQRLRHFATGDAASGFVSDVLQPLPKSVEVNVPKAAIGNKLFHDKRLSKDDTVACASCHALEKGGTDRTQYSTGVGGAVGGINSPTVYNSGLQFIQFWDGRAANLQEQADGPVNNPIEMASNWPEAFAKLSEDAAFMQEFIAVYPDGLSKENCTNAIAEFERTLITPDCKFDRYLRGETAALNEQELAGLGIFKDVGCATCHAGKLMGGQSFERMGRKADYFETRGQKMTDADNGRFNVTKNEADRHAFKVPTLRNVAVTGPYLHDGLQTDLAKVVEIMAADQLGKTLKSDEITEMVSFLNTLTGEYQGKTLQ